MFESKKVFHKEKWKKKNDVYFSVFHRKIVEKLF